MSDKESKKEKKEMKRADTKKSGFFKGVLDNLRSSVTQLPSGAKGTASEVQDIPEDKLRKELFNVAKTSRHGFPHNPTSVAYDPIQRLIAIGTHNGSIKILGRPGVEVFFQHMLSSAVVQLQFIVNEGLLLSLCADDSVHQWNIKSQTPEIIHSLKFQKERITFMYLPFQTKWLYLGTDGGNVHLVNVDTFSLSGYVINWNKAIEITRKTKPGAVVHLVENPADPNKLLIAFETGTIVLWDLRSRMAEVRFQHNEPLSSVSWHFEGKQFLASHADGSLTVFNIRNPGKPLSVMWPHLRLLMELNPELSAVPTCLKGYFHPISKVQWWATRAGDNLVLFSGGAPLGVDKNGREMVGVSVSNLQRAQLLQMESPVVDFVTAHESPFSSDTTEPYATVTLCKNDLIVVDLLTHPYPNFRLPYSMNVHESPVVCCQYLADCPGDLIPCFYSVGQFFGAKATNMSSTNIKFSEREWPITGGEWGTSIVSYPEIIITGHADGTVRFWDASTLGFQLLYRFRTSRLFEKLVSDDDPFAVEKLFFDPEGRQLGIAGASYVALFSFAKTENTCTVAVLDTPIHFEMEESSEVSPKSNERVTVRREALTWRAGLQPTLVCQFLSGGTPAGGESARHVTCMAVSSAYNLLAFGNDLGLVVVDTIHNTCVLNFATPELYDPPKTVTAATTSTPQSPVSSLTQDDDTTTTITRKSPPTVVNHVDTDDVTVAAAADDECRASSTVPPANVAQSVPSTGRTDTGEQLQPSKDPMPEKTNDKGSAKSRRPEALRRGTSIQETIADACKRTLQRMLSSPTRSSDPYQRSPRSPKRQDNNGLPDPTESSPDQSTSVSPTTLKPQRHFLDRRSKSMQTPQSGGTGASTLSASHQQLTTMSSLGAERYPGRKMLQKHPNLASQDEPPQFLLSTAASSSTAAKIRRSQIEAKACKTTQGPTSPLWKGLSTRWSLLCCSSIWRRSSGRQRETDSSVTTTASTTATTSSTTTTTTTTTATTHHSTAASAAAAAAGFESSNATSTLQEEHSISDLQRNPSKRLLLPDCSFSRSRSSSTSSLENVSRESITCLTFCDTFCSKKSDASSPSPSLWVGTSYGSVLPLPLNLANETRSALATPGTGSLFKLKGRVLCIGFVDSNGQQLVSEGGRLRSANGSKIPTGGHFAVLVSEKLARVASLPTQNTIIKTTLNETSIVVCADIMQLKQCEVPCLVSYIANGNIMVHSLPSLKFVLEVDFYASPDQRISRTFCFSKNGHGLYMDSRSEIQKFSVSSDFCNQLQDLRGNVYTTKEKPEAPRQSFFKGLFGGGPSVLDRDELFGETGSGKASKTIARHIPGNSANLEAMSQRAGTLAGEVARTRLALDERGQALSQLEERTGRMMSEAEIFASTTNQLVNKYRDKKWYQF